MKHALAGTFTLLTIALALLGTSAPAANIGISSDQECRVDITGPIEFGDFEKLAALKDHLVIDNGESTSGSMVCLNSPGGNLMEGLKMARFFLQEGVGTRIQSGKECQSVCAIMFMMGNARGPEVAFLNRRMHANSTLGFHRPYLSISEARQFTTGDIEAAYDIGIDSIYDLMSLAMTPTPWADGRMIEPDLLQLMTGTPGSEMFEIRTVEQAIRWKIEVDGILEFGHFGRPNIMFACENALNSGIALTSVRNGDGLMTADIFEFLNANSWSLQNATTGVTTIPATGRYATTSPRSGYSSISCEVAILDKSVGICGNDESSDTRIGDCRVAEDLRYFSKLITQHPLSDLRALALVADNPPDAVTFRRCRIVLPDGKQEDEEICLQTIVLVNSTGVLLLRHVLDWPSGSRTVIEIEAEVNGRTSSVSVNGQPGELVTLEDGTRCVRNSTSGNRVCTEGL